MGLLGASALASGRSFGAEPILKKYGIALVGLGSYSKGQLGPALLETKHCQLTGIVTGSPEKIPEWREKYGVPEKNVYSYDNFDEIAGNKDIDIIYVVLPTGMHSEFCIRAAKAGKHVICEKPMAGTVEECDAMIAAAREAGVGLHMGYRLWWDPYHIRLMQVAETEELGELKSIDTGFGFNQTNPDPNNWTMTKKLGIAGQLYNLGTYPVQAALYIARENPVKVTATSHNSRPEIFTEIEEGYEWEFDFPSGIKATGFASAKKPGNMAIGHAVKGDFGIDKQCYAYNGLSGFVGDDKMDFPAPNQQALQMDGICEAIHKGEKSIVPGEMGRRDIAILEAIMKSAQTGITVDLGDLGYPAV